MLQDQSKGKIKGGDISISIINSSQYLEHEKTINNHLVMEEIEEFIENPTRSFCFFLRKMVTTSYEFES